MAKSYIKAKKIWKKVFSEEELTKIWEMFLKTTDTVKGITIDWTQRELNHIIQGRNRIPVFPETDNWDNTQGIQPEQMKRLLELFTMKEVYSMFEILGANTPGLISLNAKYFDNEENYLSWKKFFKINLKDRQTLIDTVSQVLGKTTHFYYINQTANKKLVQLKEDIVLGVKSGKEVTEKRAYCNKFRHSLNSDLKIDIYSGEIDISYLEKIADIQPYEINVVVDYDNYDIDKFFEQRAKEWQTIHGFTPKIEKVLAIEPKYWVKDQFLNSMNDIFNTRQINNLTNEEITLFVKLYKLFGSNLQIVASTLKRTKFKEIPKNWIYELYKTDNGPLNVFAKIIADSRKGIDQLISIADLYKIMITFSTMNHDIESISSKKQFTIRDIDSYIDTGKLILQTPSATQLFEKFSFKDISWITKIELDDYKLERMIELYEETKDIEITKFPLVSGSVGDYEYEILPKSDIRSLLVGDMSNCCQTVGSDDNEFVEYYATHNDSTVIMITKKGKFVAQSWIWTKGKQLTFDSVECLSHDYGEFVLDCYEDCAQKILSTGTKIDLITMGSHSRTGVSLRYKEMESGQFKKLGIAYDSSTQSLIAKRSNNGRK